MRRINAFIGNGFSKIFHDRKIVIVSEGKASTIYISRKFQLIVAAFLVSAIVWMPFSAGKFVAINHLSNKQGLLKDIGNVEQRVEVLQNDMMLLQEYLRALHKYDNFELKDAQKYLAKTASKTIKRGDEISQLEDERNEVMSELKKRTLTRIYTIENFLKSAGLDYNKITGKQQFMARNNYNGAGGEGGPYIPVSLEDIQNSEQDNELSTEFIDEMNYLFELQKIVNNLPFSNPVSYNKVSSFFGIRHDPFNGSLAMHSGIDLQGPHSSRIASTGPGRVTFAGYKGAYGQMVEVYHGYGFTTRYGHLAAISVKPGEFVNRGQIIGTQGCSGRCTGEHVHYEVRIKDTPVNPVTYLVKAGDIQYFYAKKL